MGRRTDARRPWHGLGAQRPDRGLIESGFGADRLSVLNSAIRGISIAVGVEHLQRGTAEYGLAGESGGIDTLVAAIQRLAVARTVGEIQEIVRDAAREIAGSDGATFVLREGDKCHYVDENAIGPLWKGQKFPMVTCISGWSMMNRQPVVVPDIYVDGRIPHDAYRPTFVKSLAIVPIRQIDPVGAIGIYWASQNEPSERELSLLSALANSTAVAMENVAVYQELEQRVRDRTAELQAVNKALDHFSSRAAHDLRSPLGAIQVAVDTLDRDGVSDEHRERILASLRSQAEKATDLVADLLDLARASGTPRRQQLDVRALLAEIQDECPDVELRVGDVPQTIQADPVSFRQAVLNLVRNAGAYARTDGKAVVDIEATRDDGLTVFSLSDRGPGLPDERSATIFDAFERGDGDLPGSGLGLAIVGAAAEAHGGRAWYEHRLGGGAVFKLAICERA